MADISTTDEVITTEIVCPICGGSGYEKIPTEYKEVWGRVLRNGEMECENCNGKGKLMRCFIPFNMEI